MKKKALCFFIGTDAELIKLFPVILEVQKRKLEYRIISSGQNDLSHSSVLKETGARLDGLLSDPSSIQKSALGLLWWFIKTLKAGLPKIQDQLNDLDLERSIMVIHGDTISTVMGARLGVNLGMQVAHIEAGLRSHDLFNPFPEEIDRLLASHLARIHFAPGEVAVRNLGRSKGEIVNTCHNTILDSLKYSQTVNSGDTLTGLNADDYFLFVLHRQENLARKQFVTDILERVIKASRKIKCIILLHAPTEAALQRMGLMERLSQIDTIKMLPRLEYFDFMKLLRNASFVITDGGSNQEELSLMGKPCLLLRKRTERMDGIGKNAILFGGDLNILDHFVENYRSFIVPAGLSEISPSKIITDRLDDLIHQ